MKFLHVFLFLILLFTGCRENNTPGEKQNNAKEIIDIPDAGAAELSKIIENRNGRVLFINVWATWCVPCIAEFPDIVKLDEYYKNKGVDILSLNVDFNKEDSLVISFLKKYNAGFTVYNIREKESETVINLLDKEWSGAIPASFIYDKEGRKADFIIGAEDFNYFRSKIDSIKRL